MCTHIVSELASHQPTTPTRFIPCVFEHLRIAANSKNHERKLNEIVLKTVIGIWCWRSVWSRQLWQRPLSFWRVIHRKVSLEHCIQKNWPLLFKYYPHCQRTTLKWNHFHIFQIPCVSCCNHFQTLYPNNLPIPPEVKHLLFPQSMRDKCHIRRYQPLAVGTDKPIPNQTHSGIINLKRQSLTQK